MIRIRKHLRPALALTVLWSAACTSTQSAPPARAVEQPLSESALLATDPCALRLHDICGALLLYFFETHHMPAQLEDLKQSPDADTVLMFVCPRTARPYVYEPAGLIVESDPRVLFVYDAVPNADGSRWGIIGTPENGDHPLEFRVVRLTEVVLQAFLKSAPKS